MRYFNKIFPLNLIFLFIISCSAINPSGIPHRTQRIIENGQKLGFRVVQYPTSTFNLTVMQKFEFPQDPEMHIYIEGDGNSWKTRYQISDNPTPKQPLALQLALQDPHPNVMYIARPCQYTSLKEDHLCHQKFWSSHRYAPEVIAAVNEVLDSQKRSPPFPEFVLIGFSGGASVATLVAGQRKDVIRLITVAGDLNHILLNQHHKTTPLKGSLNPSDNVDLVRHIPQYHWCGTQDSVVPCWTVEAFCKKADNPQLIQCGKIQGATHHSKWEKQWKEILRKSLPLPRAPSR